MKDPRDRMGLAHFCEHMLFLGSNKYKEENAYRKWIKEHGGKCNAYTSYNNTNFMFDVSNEGLEKALDIFANVFISPLFDE